MPILWKLEESRLLQLRSNASAANADSLTLGAPGPPLGKLWVVISFGYLPNVAEAQVVSVSKETAIGGSLGLLNPISLNLNPAIATFLENGAEYWLMPGEYFTIRRLTHTAGSTMAAFMQIIEVDQPLYTYEEPQVVKRVQSMLSTTKQRLFGGGGARPVSAVPARGRTREGRPAK